MRLKASDINEAKSNARPLEARQLPAQRLKSRAAEFCCDLQKVENCFENFSRGLDLEERDKAAEGHP